MTEVRPQEVLFEFPPIYSQIAAVFRIHERRDLVFSFGAIIYNPHELFLPPEVVVHEGVHGRRQGEGEFILDWWQQYMEDPTFRFVEELHAHREEYRWLMEHGDRKQRRRACKHVAGKLAAPLYGQMCSRGEARKLLKALL